jgi:type IV secretion system protein VirB10
VSETPHGITLNVDPPHRSKISRRWLYIAFLLAACLVGALYYGLESRRNSQAIQRQQRSEQVELKPASSREAVRGMEEQLTRREAASEKREAVELPTVSQQQQPPAKLPQRRAPRVMLPGEPAEEIPDTPQSRQVSYRENARSNAPTPEQIQQERIRAAQLAPLGAFSSRQDVGPSPSGPVALPRMPAGYGNPGMPNMATTPGMPTNFAPTPGGPTQGEYQQVNGQENKRVFLAAARAASRSNYLQQARVPQVGAYEIKAGWEIPAVMEQDLNSDLPGEIKALVSQNVYDTATGQYLLIPQGARLIGTYSSDVSYGQEGVQAVWDRIIFPDASSINLEGMQGLDSHGNAGLRHDVDRHYKRLFGMAVLSTLFVIPYELTQRRNNTGGAYGNVSAADSAYAAVGRELSQTGSQITRRNLNVQPTIKVPVGYRFTVRVNRDILFEAPYEPMPSQDAAPQASSGRIARR